VDALKPNARLILLGDKDQLASVESGAVLADLTQALINNTVELQHAYRFNQTIKNFADAINQQQTQKAWQQLTANTNEVLSLLPQEELINYSASHYSQYLALIKKQASFYNIYSAFNQFRVLCANRTGKNSVTQLNQLIEQALINKRAIQKAGVWYVGRPVMVTQNNPALHLYNGDIGLCLQENNTLVVCFLASDGSIKRYLPARIPACETAFAMTIHKSQGSEFKNIVIALPDSFNAVLTKELLYTAITRAKESINIVAEKTIFMQTIKASVNRMTGLASKLITGVQ
jgi:exodeoxyribonuclease V alpha subunit